MINIAKLDNQNLFQMMERVVSGHNEYEAGNYLMTDDKAPVEVFGMQVIDELIQEQIFSELGLSMTTAVNIFLRTTIREHGIPFALKLDVPNETTATAIEEGRRIALNSSVKGYTSMDELKAALDL
jgi:DNA-damage-inducible protein J